MLFIGIFSYIKYDKKSNGLEDIEKYIDIFKGIR
jgi:hypothetical protein